MTHTTNLVAKALAEIPFYGAVENGRDYVVLPLMTPCGAFITVYVEASGELLRVSDGGKAHAQLFIYDRERPDAHFERCGDLYGTLWGNGELYSLCPEETLMQTLLHVAHASLLARIPIYEADAEPPDSRDEAGIADTEKRNP